MHTHTHTCILLAVNRRHKSLVTLPLLLGLLFFRMAIEARTFEFLNKLNIPIEFAVGDHKSPPTMSSTFQTLAPGKSYTRRLEPGPDYYSYEQLLFKDPKAPNIGFLYEFRGSSRKNIYVRLIEDKGKISLEPQVRIIWPNLDKEDIFLLKTLGISQDLFFDDFDRAIRKKDINALKSMFQGVSAQDINVRDKNGATPLMYAAKAKYFPLVQFLIEKGANINAQDKWGNTPLHLAGSLDIAQFLIARGADVNKRNNQGSIPPSLQTFLDREFSRSWMEDIGNKQYETFYKNAKNFLKQGANINKALIPYLDPLHVDKYMLSLIAENLQNPSSRFYYDITLPLSGYGSEDGTTVIHRVLEWSREAVEGPRGAVNNFLKPLLDIYKKLPLDMYKKAFGVNNEQEKSAYIKKALDIKNKEGKSAYMIAIEKGYTDAAKFLKDAGADVSDPSIKLKVPSVN